MPVAYRIEDLEGVSLIPGEHVVLLCDPGGMLRARQLGLSLRDTLFLMMPQGVVTAALFRVPLDAPLIETVLDKSAGALWIEGCRISVTPAAGGRWPTNLLFVHALSCKTEGCATTCPVPILDEQSGERTSGTGAVKRETSAGHQGNAYGKENRPAGTPMLSYGDTGGTSRYYPRVDTFDEALAWFTRLVQGPPR